MKRFFMLPVFAALLLLGTTGCRVEVDDDDDVFEEIEDAFD